MHAFFDIKFNFQMGRLALVLGMRIDFPDIQVESEFREENGTRMFFLKAIFGVLAIVANIIPRYRIF